MAKLVPADEPPPRTPIFGYMAGTAEIRGDIVSTPPLAWSALTGAEDRLYGELNPGVDASPRTRRRSKRRP